MMRPELLTEVCEEMSGLPDGIVEVISDIPIRLGLSFNGTPVGLMRITNKIEFSLEGSVWVDYDEALCECGMALKWNGAIVL